MRVPRYQEHSRWIRDFTPADGGPHRYYRVPRGLVILLTFGVEATVFIGRGDRQ